MYIINTILGRGEWNSTSMCGGADACIALLLMLGKVTSETSLWSLCSRKRRKQRIKNQTIAIIMLIILLIKNNQTVMSITYKVKIMKWWGVITIIIKIDPRLQTVFLSGWHHLVDSGVIPVRRCALEWPFLEKVPGYSGSEFERLLATGEMANIHLRQFRKSLPRTIPSTACGWIGAVLSGNPSGRLEFT